MSDLWSDKNQLPENVTETEYNLHEDILCLKEDNQQLKQRIEQLKREYVEQKAALEIVADKLNLKADDCNFVHWLDEALAQRDIEQQIKGLEDLEIDPVDYSQEIILSIIESRIEQLQKDCCQHNWVTAKNEHVKNGSVCSKCFAISELEPEQLHKGVE